MKAVFSIPAAKRKVFTLSSLTPFCSRNCICHYAILQFFSGQNSVIYHGWLFFCTYKKKKFLFNVIFSYDGQLSFCAFCKVKVLFQYSLLMETVQKFEHVCHILKELYTVYTVEIQFDLTGH